MGLRFRRSVKLAPGLRLNFSGSGMSLSAGPRGASLNFGSRGAFFNAGIPGTGLYGRQRIASGLAPSRAATPAQSVRVSVTVKVEDDGTVTFFGADGNPLPPNLVQQTKKQQGDFIRDLIRSSCDTVNAHVEGIANIHLATPNPLIRPHYEPKPFEDPVPARPIPKRHGLLGFLFKGVRERIDKENAEATSEHEAAVRRWEMKKASFEAEEARRKKLVEQDVLEDEEAMNIVLSESLQDIVWPRETMVSFEVLDHGRRVFLDVDLPEIHDMPTRTASVPSRGYKLTLKELSATRRQQLYMRHVHGIGFRIVGEAFSVLPKADEVVLSAYSQRPDKSTGHVNDEYLYSVRVKRLGWGGIRFDNLEEIDVVEAFSRFELLRDMSKTGVFKPIVPMQP